MSASGALEGFCRGRGSSCESTRRGPSAEYDLAAASVGNTDQQRQAQLAVGGLLQFALM